MPKIGAKADERPYNRRCKVCGCLVEKLVSRFGFNGKPAAHAYRCGNAYHGCGTLEREGCEPVRVYGEPVAHGYSTEEHPGPRETCDRPECLEARTHRAGLSPSGTLHPGKYEDCYEQECEPPF